jgi:hypothetical protein
MRYFPAGLIDADRRPVERFRQKLLNARLLAREFITSEGLELEMFHALRDLPGRTKSTATSRKPSAATSEPWISPARSPAHGTRPTR